MPILSVTLALVPIFILMIGIVGMLYVAMRNYRSLGDWWDILSSNTDTMQAQFLKDNGGTPNPQQFKGLPYVANAHEAALDSAAHTVAWKAWCKAENYNWYNEASKCTYTEAQCVSESNGKYDLNLKPPQTQKPWLRFIQGACYQANEMQYYVQTCNKMQPFTANKRVYVPPVLECGGGRCIEDEKQKIWATCVQPKDYCDRMGLDYTSSPRGPLVDDNGQVVQTNAALGSCTESDAQAIAEAILSKTVVRTYKRNFNQAYDACKRDLMSSSCAVDSFKLWFTPVEIAVDTIKQEYHDAMKEIKEGCRNAIKTGSGSDVGECILGCLDTNPAFYLGHKFVQNMIIPLFKMIPWGDLGHDIEQGARDLAQGVVKYGSEFVDTISKLGPQEAIKAARAISKYGEQAFQAVQTLLQGAGGDISEISKGITDITSKGVGAISSILSNGIAGITSGIGGLLRTPASDIRASILTVEATYQVARKRLSGKAAEGMIRKWTKFGSGVDYLTSTDLERFLRAHRHPKAAFLQDVGKELEVYAEKYSALADVRETLLQMSVTLLATTA